MFKKFLTNKEVLLAGILMGLVIAAASSVWATSIGTNLSVDGTVTVTGASTFNGNVTLGDAATDINLFTGLLHASTTALFTTGITTYGNSTFGDASTDTNIFTGTLQASTTALFTGASTFYGNVTMGDSADDAFTLTAGTSTLSRTSNTMAHSFATSSAAVPFLGFDTTNYRIGIGSSTPAATFSVGGAGTLTVGAAAPIGTSTVTISSSGASQGGCINLRATDGTMIRIYATTSTVVGKMGYNNLVVEAGDCR